MTCSSGSSSWHSWLMPGGGARASFRASCDWRGGSNAQAGVASSWTLECVRRPDGWKFRRVLAAKVGPGYRIDLADVWQY